MAVIQLPSCVGLVLCQSVIIEEKTRNITLVNSFKRLEVNEFPSPAVPFAVYAILTDGLGKVTLDLSVLRTDTLDEIYAKSVVINFSNPLRQLRVWWRIQSCSFPVPGPYQFGLLANRDLITQSTLEVASGETNHG